MDLQRIQLRPTQKSFVGQFANYPQVLEPVMLHRLKALEET